MTDDARPCNIFPKRARSLGFKIDTTVYPWVAYKGLRANPTEQRPCDTDKEEAYFEACEYFCRAINFLTYGATSGHIAIAEAMAGKASYDLEAGLAAFRHARAL